MHGLAFFHADAPGHLEGSVYEPALCIILQGSKRVAAYDHVIELSAGSALVVSQALPVMSMITGATKDTPYLSVVLFLDLHVLRALHGQLADDRALPSEERPLSACPTDTAWLEPLVRYASLASSPLDAEVLGPATYREIHYRLLLSSAGRSLRLLLHKDSRASMVERAIRHLRSGYRGTLRIADLAHAAAMSTSSFHQHFRAITGTTPLQYQKDLRLIEARSLLTSGTHNVSQAAFSVGYESPSQFSRDYCRRFGAPPKTALSDGATHRRR